MTTGNDNNPLQLITSMGWEQLPYGCVGMARHRRINDASMVWSWLILIPWAVNDTKPWVDGTKVYDLTLKSEDAQREAVFAEMRTILDERYGDTVAERTVEAFLRDIEKNG